VYDVKTFETILKLRSHLLTIKAHTPLIQTITRIKKSKNKDFVFVEKAQIAQMVGVLITRLYGKRFIWIQGFSNPPSPGFIERLLLSQADKILTENERDVKKLKNFGLEKSKIKLLRRKN